MKIATDEVDVYGVGSDPDAMLALRARNDPEAFGLLYARYVHRVYAYCKRRLNDEESVRDATSAVMLKALEGLYCSRVNNVASWIFSIAHNEVVSLYRRRHMTVGLEFAVNIVTAASRLRTRRWQALRCMSCASSSPGSSPNKDKSSHFAWPD